MPNYSDSDCVGGVSYFADRDNALLLQSDLLSWGLVLDAETSDDIAAVWPVVCASFGDRNCLSLEVMDITSGLPDLGSLSSAPFYPDSDLFNSATFAVYPPTYSLTASPIYPALNHPTLTPWTWPSTGRPVDSDAFTFGIYGLGYEYAFQVGGLAGTYTAEWVTKITLRYVVQRLSEGDDKTAATYQPYIQWDGNRFWGDTITVSDEIPGGTVVYVDWWANPATGLPWTVADLEQFDTASGSTCGFGLYAFGTGASGTLATIFQAWMIVESAPVDFRLAIGSLCPPQTQKQGWQSITLFDPADSTAPINVQLTPGNRYLWWMRKTIGHALAVCRLDEAGVDLPGPPFWTSIGVNLDQNSHRIVSLGDAETQVAGFGLELPDGSFSLDSQLYATTSPEGLDTQDAWPDIGAYFRMSPVDRDHTMAQQFTPNTTGVYAWLRINCALATGQSDGDLIVQIRTVAGDVVQATQIITANDLEGSKVKWQTLGFRLDSAPTLNAGTRYYFAASSLATHTKGWLVQVLNAGTLDGPPTGPPANLIETGFGQSTTPSDNLIISSGTYTDAVAEINVAILPDPPEELIAVVDETVCCVTPILLSWLNPIIVGCGGFGATEIDRSDDEGTTWYTIARLTDESVETMDDYESKRNQVAQYRARTVRGDGVPSDWTDVVEATATQECCGLILTSNVMPELGAAYPDIGNLWRMFTWPRDEQVYQPSFRNFQLVWSELEDRGTMFGVQVLVRGDQVNGTTPCTASECFDFDLVGEDVFDPIKAIARADLPYVCVHNEHGNRWFAHVTVSEGSWMVDGEIFTATVNVVEITDRPYIVSMVGGS